MKRIWIPILVLLLAGGGFFAYQRYQQVQAASQNNYETAQVQLGDLTATVGATGTVRANQTVILSWQTTGMIGSVDVEVGQIVETGQLLSSIRQDSLPQEIILAEAELVEAQRALDALQDSDTAQAQAQLTLVTAQKAYDDAKRKFDNLQRPRASQETIA